MLAQNYLTADELQCTERERDAAIKVLGMLERGELEFVPEDRVWTTLIENGFNMGVWTTYWNAADQCQPPHHLILAPLTLNVADPEDTGSFDGCGTVGCIGGWMRIVGGSSPTATWDDLFYPKESHAWDASVEQAAKALRGKLTTGKADWT